ncbi:9291_t:CDS:1, partial [Paraglomus occultum]
VADEIVRPKPKALSEKHVEQEELLRQTTIEKLGERHNAEL